jgi:hypothetical protein
MYREIVWKGMNLIQLAHLTARCPSNTVLEFDPIKSGIFEASFKRALPWWSLLISAVFHSQTYASFMDTWNCVHALWHTYIHIAVLFVSLRRITQATESMWTPCRAHVKLSAFEQVFCSWPKWKWTPRHLDARNAIPVMCRKGGWLTDISEAGQLKTSGCTSFKLLHSLLAVRTVYNLMKQL